MVCSGQKESYYKCGRGLIYQPSSTKCVSIKEVDPGKYYDNLYKVFLRSFLTCRKNLFQILVLSIAIKMELNAQADCATNFLQPMKLQENSSFFWACLFLRENDLYSLKCALLWMRNNPSTSRDGRFDGRKHNENVRIDFWTIHYLAFFKLYDMNTSWSINLSNILFIFSSEMFCVGRPDGNFRNPWNCHHYFTCHYNRTFDRPCSTKTILNYSPKDDLCEFSFQMRCDNISELVFIWHFPTGTWR